MASTTILIILMVVVMPSCVKLDDVVKYWREFNECTSDTIVNINDNAARRVSEMASTRTKYGIIG
jgi:hypothetical protein